MFCFAIFADVSLIVVDLLTELWYLLHKKMKWNGMVWYLGRLFRLSVLSNFKIHVGTLWCEFYIKC